MTTLTLPETPLERLRWPAHDAMVVARRGLIHWVRNPAVIVSSLLYPMIMVLLFGFVFGSAMTVAGGGNYREFLMPGMYGQAMMFGVATTLAIVTAEASRGVTDRYRSMPISLTGVVIGRSLIEMVNAVLELTILIGCGLAVGWRWHEGPASALAAVALLLLVRFALIWLGIYLGLLLTPEAAGAAWMPLMPFTMLANTFVSPSQMPGWLGTISEWNPLSSTVAACRELFGNPGLGGDSWAAQHALLLAIAWPVVLVAIFLPLSVRGYRRLSR